MRKSKRKVRPSYAIGTWANPYGRPGERYVNGTERGSPIEGCHKKRGGET